MPTPLLEDLQTQKISLQEFHDVTLRALDHMNNVVSYEVEERGYIIKSSTSSGTTKYVRPIQKNLFIFDKTSFSKEFKNFIDILSKVKMEHKDKTKKASFEPKTNHHNTINSVVYTIQQSIGAGLDLLGEPNSNRKHVGNRFEELIRLITSEIGIANKKVVFNIPYKVGKKTKYYKSETDMIISPFDKIKSKPRNIHPMEVVVSTKTSSKDRMPKTFIDKKLLQEFSGEDKLKVAGIFLNDVQRKKRDNGTMTVSFTLVANLFMVYTEFITKLEGVYFVDPPPKALESPWDKHIFKFSKFVIEDVWDLIS